jgi:predicted secreted protein
MALYSYKSLALAGVALLPLMGFAHSAVAKKSVAAMTNHSMLLSESVSSVGSTKMTAIAQNKTVQKQSASTAVSAQPTKQSARPVAAANNSTVVQLAPNNITFKVTLKSNPTTGFMWYLVKNNDKMIVPVSAKFSPPANKKMIGAPGSVTWTFRATPDAFAVPRKIIVQLLYARPWQPNSGQPYTITIMTHR